MRTRRRLGVLLPLLAGLVLACTAAGPVAAETLGQLRPRSVRPKPVHTQWRQGWHKNLVVLKCAEGSRVRMRSGLLVSLNGTPLQGLHGVLQAHGNPGVRRLFSRPEATLDQERSSGQLCSGLELADLNLYFLLTSLPGSDTEQLVDDLNALAVVELAYFEPLAVRGAIHPEPSWNPAVSAAGMERGHTPDFCDLQVYLDPAPLGVAAEFSWELPGGKGQGVRLGLVERGLNPNHEDLPWPESWAGGHQDFDHGTAVAGEILGQHNGIGVMGIAPETELHVSLFATDPPFPVIADAINKMSDVLSIGDVMLIEYHAQGPASGEECLCSCYSFEYVPLEYWPANFDAIAAITAAQVICVEIGGNGSMDLDHPRYQGAFERGIRDSGAILVGAAHFGSRKPACWTNFGSRFDVHGHATGVVTSGYGLLFNGGPNAKYTAGFGGTSAAGAMVAGAVCAFQGWWRAETGDPMDPVRMLQHLRYTGSSQAADPRQVGPLPDLRTAICGRTPVIRFRTYSEQ